MFEKLHISVYRAFYTAGCNPAPKDLKKGEAYKEAGLEISPDHQHVTVEPYSTEPLGNIMKCTVSFKDGTTKMIEKSTTIDLAVVNHIDFNDNYDDKSFSFKNLDWKFTLNRYYYGIKRGLQSFFSKV